MTENVVESVTSQRPGVKEEDPGGKGRNKTPKMESEGFRTPRPPRSLTVTRFQYVC